MTKTTNYQLPQWETEDPVCREDFNGAMANIDAGITAARQAAKTAQGAADAAQGTANTARTEAAALPYVVGRYTGTGEVLTITLGFRPRYVIISGQKETYTTNSITEFDRYFGMSAGNVMPHRIVFTDAGFTVNPAESPYYYNPNFNDAGRVYDYIAFK